jgi:hypothetical protein
VCALNLVDAAEGAGGAFYGRYQRLLPPIHELQLPFTLRGSHLAQVSFRELLPGIRRVFDPHPCCKPSRGSVCCTHRRQRR